MFLFIEIGQGVDKNPTESLKWYRKVADGGHVLTQFHLGVYYRDGSNGVTQDHKQAFDWFYKSALQGDIDAMNALGYAYEVGMYNSPLFIG
jgi:TPR repeat protein